MIEAGVDSKLFRPIVPVLITEQWRRTNRPMGSLPGWDDVTTAQHQWEASLPSERQNCQHQSQFGFAVFLTNLNDWCTFKTVAIHQKCGCWIPSFSLLELCERIDEEIDHYDVEVINHRWGPTVCQACGYLCSYCFRFNICLSTGGRR